MDSLSVSYTKIKRNTSKRTSYSFCSVKEQYKMEIELEISLNHVSKTKSSYFMNISETEPKLFLVSASNNHKRNLGYLLKMI